MTCSRCWTRWTHPGRRCTRRSSVVRYAFFSLPRIRTGSDRSLCTQLRRDSPNTCPITRGDSHRRKSIRSSQKLMRTGVRAHWPNCSSAPQQRCPVCATGRLLWRTYMQDDVRDVLVAVHAPTLIMARPGDRLVPFEASASRAAGLPNAQLLTLPPGDHPGFDIADLVVSEILTFCEKPSAAKAQRVVTTVMFTDIVGSTEQLSVTGDEHWRHRLDVHDQVVDTMLSEYGGRRIQHTGDGVFSMFDAPPSRAVRCGLKLVSALATQGIRIRVGIHVRECEKRGDNWSGLAIRTAPTCFASVHQQAQRSPAVDACRTSILSSVF